MVGAGLAGALAGQSLRIAVVEPVPLSAARQPSYDDRAVALSLGSRRILDGMGVWDGIAAEAVAIDRIHVSDRGHFGFTRISARQEGVEALGYVAEARVLGPVLMRKLGSADNVDLICPARVEAIRLGDDAVEAELGPGETRRRVSARLLVAADGGRSLVRQTVGIGARERDYGQTAVIANVTPGRSHDHTAYERFTESGPMALLPMAEDRCALVWTVPREMADEIMALSDEDFLERLQARFGDRLGRFHKVGGRSAYPLVLIRAREQFRHRLAVIGNAAHTLHPIAGQGFNLGLRDVAVLAQVLADAARAGTDPGSPAVLERYAAWRKADQGQVTWFTDALVRIFSNRLAPMILARNVGLVALDLMPSVKHGLARAAMGLSGRQPRLARGLPL